MNTVKPSGVLVFRTVIKVIALILIFCLTCVAAYFISCYFAGERSEFLAASHIENIPELPVIVIDAGHGGIDGGASAPDGGMEKEINLDVANRLFSLLKFSGVDCVMTRTEDKLLADESMKSHRKMTDLKNRLAVLNDITKSGREAVFVSIHMNNFSIPKYSGLQVWYSQNDERSKNIAERVQSFAKTYLDSANGREIKKAGSGIYLLDRAKAPAILIECGFLSNPEEYEKLKTSEYRNKLAVAVYGAICDSFSK